jgi:hypothetical protein
MDIGCKNTSGAMDDRRMSPIISLKCTLPAKTARTGKMLAMASCQAASCHLPWAGAWLLFRSPTGSLPDAQSTSDAVIADQPSRLLHFRGTQSLGAMDCPFFSASDDNAGSGKDSRELTVCIPERLAIFLFSGFGGLVQLQPHIVVDNATGQRAGGDGEHQGVFAGVQ